MLVALIAVHFGISMAAPVLARWLGNRAFLLVAVCPAAAFGWLTTQAARILSGTAYLESRQWIPALSVDLSFRVSALQLVLGLIVTGIGALVLVYCRWYFGDEKPATKCLGLLPAFAGAMLGLVTADNLIVLYVFWELTTVFSYLLIGYDSTRQSNRSAALTALIVTSTGGLAMLAGIVIVGVSGSTFSMSAIIALPPSSTAAGAGALLMLVGGLSKSALVPFHFWLPGSMAAPSPVSAYLHAAAMVKAGVYLVAVLAPAFASVPGWRLLIPVLGAATMIVGGWRSLRQTDLKLLLAYGTVSQLGFLMLLLGLGTQAAALAGLGLVITHALFKSTLFLSVGVIDHATGTRDLTQLSGLRRGLPVLAVVAGVAAASMAGLPPLLGFIAKESAFEALLHLVRDGDGTGMTPPAALLLTLAILLGSTLTVAYSLRFWWGAFAVKTGAEIPAQVREPHHQPGGMMIAPVILVLFSLSGGFAGPWLTDVLSHYAGTVPTGQPGLGLALWHGWSVPLAMSGFAVAGGAILFGNRAAVARVQATFPRFTSADEFYKKSMRFIDQSAVWITAQVQRGSLVSYLSTILVVVVLGVGGSLMFEPDWPAVRWYDNVAQIVVGAIIIAAALATASSRGRVRAILLVGTTGYGLALLFLLHGAPDLALTQVLVETVSLLVFLLVIRTLPKYFSSRPLQSSRWWRIVLAIAVGVTVTGLALMASGSRIWPPVSEPMPEVTYTYGFGTNIVNVMLVDTRAWDTLGEISVLVVAATGVASLIFLRTVQPDGSPSVIRAIRSRSRTDSPGVWLRGVQALDPGARSLVFEVVTRLLFVILMVVSVWMLLAGHNWPGGGFAAGLMAGMALFVRYLAAGRKELDEAAPVNAGQLLGFGLLLAVGTVITPVFFGGKVLQSYDVHLHIPGWDAITTPVGQLTLLGDVHLVSSTIFDSGVYLVVIGTLLSLVRSLGSGIDVQELETNGEVAGAVPVRTAGARGEG